MTTVEQLADELGVDVGDVRTVVRQIAGFEVDPSADEIPDQLAAEVRDVLSPGGVRSVESPPLWGAPRWWVRLVRRGRERRAAR